MGRGPSKKGGRGEEGDSLTFFLAEEGRERRGTDERGASLTPLHSPSPPLSLPLLLPPVQVEEAASEDPAKEERGRGKGPEKLSEAEDMC